MKLDLLYHYYIFHFTKKIYLSLSSTRLLVEKSSLLKGLYRNREKKDLEHKLNLSHPNNIELP